MDSFILSSYLPVNIVWISDLLIYLYDYIWFIIFLSFYLLFFFISFPFISFIYLFVHLFVNYLTSCSFSHQRCPVVSHKNLSDSKSSQVSWTFLSTLADFNNGVVWMISSLPLISSSSNLLFKLLRTVPNTIDITVTFIFHSFFSSPARSKYLFIVSLSFIFTLWFTGTAKSNWRPVLFYYYSILFVN